MCCHGFKLFKIKVLPGAADSSFQLVKGETIFRALEPHKLQFRNNLTGITIEQYKILL